MLKRIALLLLVALPLFLAAATGCDLNDPDADVKRLFPESTGYKTSYLSLTRIGGKTALQEVEKRLGDRFTGSYEQVDVPYTLYSVFRDKALLGYVHGVNQKGQYGGLQVFLALNPQGKITDFYFQKLSSKQGKLFKSKEFASQFKGLSLKDFTGLNIKTGKGTGKAAAIKNPAETAKTDFLATLRGVKKNLILMDMFVFNKK